MKLIYPGPFPAVDVPSLGLVDVAQGDEVDVPDEAAAGLVRQGWGLVDEVPAKRGRKPAADE